MNVMPTKGYDPLINDSVAELTAMYIQEGVTPAEAKKRAQEVSAEINVLNKAEQRSWKRAREHEKPIGLMIDQAP